MNTSPRKRLALLSAVLMGLVIVYFLHHAYRTPILMYHHVDYSKENPGNSYVSPETFERQMEFLKVHGYRVVPLRELVEMRKNGVMPLKTVAITFDDGYLDNIKNAFPVLRKMDFPATVFVITQEIGNDSRLSEEDLKVLEEGGVSVESHSVTHAYLPELPPEEQEFEIAESKRRLEEMLGHPVRFFSYPVGGYTPEVKAFAEKAGYEAAFTTNRIGWQFDPYAIRRIRVSESRGSLFSFWLKTTGFYHVGKKTVPPHTDR